MNAEPPRPTKKRQLAAEERQRAVRACAECRRLKEKCEDGIPCKRCRHLRRPCELAPASATVDRRTSDLTGSFKDLKDRSKYMELILKHHFPDLKLDTDTLRRTYDSLSLPTTRIQSLEAVTDSNEASEDDRPTESPGIEDENCTLDDVDDTTTHYSGEFSHWNFSMHIKRNIDELIATSNVPGMDKVKRLPDFIRVGEADPDSTSMSDIIALLPPRPVATFLITVFFKHATSFYYYVDRKWLDGFLDRIYTDCTTMGPKDTTAACVVLMVWAVGTQYVHLESPRQHNNRALGSAESQGGWELQIGSAFYRQVAKLLSEVIHSGSLLSVQVFLLLGLYSLPIDASGIGYIYLNLAVKLAIQNGLHRKLARADIDADAKETRRRLWWTIYCMERKIGIYHGRPQAIVRSDIDSDMPQKRDTSDASIYSFEPSGLLESINLISQAESFLQEITRLRSCPRSDMGPVLDRIKHMKSNLRGSWTPPRDSTSSPTNTTNHLGQTTSRAEIHSRLECCLLHMFIGRPFILAHRQRQVKSRCSPKHKSTGHARRDTVQDQWDFLVKDCVAAAIEAITICHAMQTGSRGIAKASYTEYSSCRASLLVLIAYSICYRTNEFSRTLQRGLDVIREMASVGDSARSEVSLLETLEAALHRLHVFDSCSDQTVDIHHNDQSDEGYEGFVNWYSQLTSSTSFSARPSVAGYGTIIQETILPSQDSHLQSRFVMPNAEASSTHQDVFVDDFPFDFGLLNPDTNVAFFNPDFNGYGNPERELFKDFL